MKDPNKKIFIYLMFSIFGGIALSILLFFVVYRFQLLSDCLTRLGQIMAPFIYGSVVAYLLRPMCNHFEDFFQNILPKRLKQFTGPLSVGLSMVTGVLLVYALIIMIAPQLYNSILSFWDGLPDKVNQFTTWARETFGGNEKLLVILNRVNNSIKEFTDALYVEVEKWAEGTLMPYLSNIIGIIGGVGSSVYKVLLFLYNLLIGLIVACYMLASRKKFARQSVLIVRSIFVPEKANMILQEAAFVDRMFGGFIDGKILDSAIVGVLCYIGCMICRFPNALLVSAIVGITNVIPFFGPFIGGVPATLLIMLENPIKGLWFILFILGLQQLDGNVIGPKILGDRTGLSSFWVLFAIVLCGGLWGIVGMVICVPLFAVIYDVVKRFVRRGLAKKGQTHIWDNYKAEYPDELNS